MPKILIVEDNAITSFHMQLLLEMKGYEASKVSNGEEAIKHIAINLPDVILMDILLNGTLNGIETMEEIRQINPNIPVIFISALTDNKTILQIDEINNAQSINKPFNEEELMTMIANCTHKSR